MMATYTSQAISGYNASPPSDDGSQTSTNEITWSKHKTKLGDPIKTLAEAINTALVASTPSTDGTAEASKYITTDSNKDVTALRNITGTGTATFAAFAGPLTGNVTGNADTATNSTKWNGAAKTVSASAPSGGASGDIWFQYV